MWPRPLKHQSAPELPGKYYKFMLEKPPISLQVFAPGAAPISNREPYVLMHMRKPGAQNVVPKRDTAVDEAYTPVDAPPSGAASEITPDDLLDEVSGSIEHLSLAGAASNSDRAALEDSCARCGKTGVALKRCSCCKNTWYCGTACQNASWKQHKKTCTPKTCAPLPSLSPQRLADAVRKVKAANDAGDWRRVLEWKGRMEELLVAMELMGGETHGGCDYLLWAFTRAHESAKVSTTNKESVDNHVRSIIGLEKRRIDGLGQNERFRDQGTVMNNIAENLFLVDEDKEATVWFERARALGAAHGFFSSESSACRGLGKVAMCEGRHEEGLDLLRNSVAASTLNEWDCPSYELNALQALILGLFMENEFDELEPIVLRFQKVAKAESLRSGRFDSLELKSLIFNARLHEVVRIAPRIFGNLFTLPGPCIPPRPISFDTGSTAPES